MSMFTSTRDACVDVRAVNGRGSMAPAEGPMKVGGRETDDARVSPRGSPPMEGVRERGGRGMGSRDGARSGIGVRRRDRLRGDTDLRRAAAPAMQRRTSKHQGSQLEP